MKFWLAGPICLRPSASRRIARGRPAATVAQTRARHRRTASSIVALPLQEDLVAPTRSLLHVLLITVGLVIELRLVGAIALTLSI